jgi:hypothetical protein
MALANERPQCNCRAANGAEAEDAWARRHEATGNSAGGLKAAADCADITATALLFVDPVTAVDWRLCETELRGL